VIWVAYTPKEGRWPFTMAPTPEEACENLMQAIIERRVLSIPFQNPISAVLANEYDRAFLRHRQKDLRRLERECR
jgi:hypothetical protein